MAKKKNMTPDKLISFYMDYVLMHNQAPKSVYAFAKDNNFDEADFYKHFASFEALEKAIFKIFFNNTMRVLEASEDYQSFDARNKLLSFYFTFFENLTANRSYVVYALKDKGPKAMSTLSELKQAFKKFIDTLDIESIDIKEPRITKLQDYTKQESFWIQLMMVMKFWMDDTSASFEKTDIFIEKAINAGFDLMDVKPLKSVLDLGKFLFKEKMH
ncbi:TetR family transcriptional regulator C-terminal domain-containing protein [Bizionia sediminis]|uniref:TetR family transcriptional regulator C-terminal domain-containing protein n=1 Tax=Bizionia sediminis TaxID=1737064 RepID=A0ABW5KS08_9FLAO